MTTVVAFVSQKGGVGKSTLARALAREAVASGLKVKIGDLDPDQATIVDWHRVRTQRAIEPVLSVELFRNAAQALAAADGHDLLVLDGPAKASAGTTEIARRADLIVQPTGAGRDDLTPAIRVFHGLGQARHRTRPARLRLEPHRNRQRGGGRPDATSRRRDTRPSQVTCPSGRHIGWPRTRVLR